MPTTLAELLTLERECRQAKKWLSFAGTIKNEKGAYVDVRIKSFGFYNQILHVDDSVNLASGHTLNTVLAMHTYLKVEINKANP
jgi:hypothetical protein